MLILQRQVLVGLELAQTQPGKTVELQEAWKKLQEATGDYRREQERTGENRACRKTDGLQRQPSAIPWDLPGLVLLATGQ